MAADQVPLPKQVRQTELVGKCPATTSSPWPKRHKEPRTRGALPNARASHPRLLLSSDEGRRGRSACPRTTGLSFAPPPGRRQARGRRRRCVRRRRSSAGGVILGESGHGSGWAVRVTAAITAPELHPGCICRTRAATPAACGEAIDVPVIQMYLAVPSTAVIPGKIGSSSSSKNSQVPSVPVLVQAPRTASCTLSVAAK